MWHAPSTHMQLACPMQSFSRAKAHMLFEHGGTMSALHWQFGVFWHVDESEMLRHGRERHVVPSR